MTFSGKGAVSGAPVFGMHDPHPVVPGYHGQGPHEAELLDDEVAHREGVGPVLRQKVELVQLAISYISKFVQIEATVKNPFAKELLFELWTE
jgi:hypothetical protein